MSAPPPPPGYYYPPGAYAPPSRPIGVAILAILTVLVGVLILLAAILVLVAPAFIIGFGLPIEFGIAVGVVGGILLIIALLWIAVGMGLWRLRGWAWWLAVIVMVLSIVSSFAAPGAAIVPILLLVYLILVRKHFR